MVGDAIKFLVDRVVGALEHVKLEQLKGHMVEIGAVLSF